jgi:hypothetical protein
MDEVNEIINKSKNIIGKESNKLHYLINDVTKGVCHDIA